MLDRRNYVELVALLLVVVLFSLHLPLWGMIMDACAEPMIESFWVDIIGYADRRADNDILATRLIVSYE